MRIAQPACRIAWRPSRWETCGLLALGIVGALGVLASDLPAPWRSATAAAALLVAGLRATHARRRGPRILVVSHIATLDGVRLATLHLQWRGPLAFVQARDVSGRVHRLAWWPDTLPRTQRRALRLAVAAVQP